MCAGNVYHLEDIGYPVTLHQLKIHSVNTPCQLGNIVNGDATFISNNRDWDVLTNEPQSVQIMRGDRLLDKLNIVRSECINHPDRFFRCPSSVRIDTNGCR